MTDLAALKRANERRWANAKITRGAELTSAAKRLVANKARYVAVSVKTGVPWVFIAVTHLRESNANFSKSLAQGDPWNVVSTHVPKGRGPFASWEAAAIDALVACAPYAAKNTDWSVGGTLTMLERYNGLGYANKGLPSPYVWSGTDQYKSGKYVADGVFDASAVDKQLGCAGVILAMMALDSTISFGAKPMTQVTPAKPAAVPVTPAEHAKVGGAVVVATAGAGATAAVQSGVSVTAILLWIGGLSAVAIAAFIIGYRIIKGVWPWTGNQSQELLLPSPQPSEKSLELASAQLALSSADLPATPSPKSSELKPPRKRSAKPSRKIPARRTSSPNSKRIAAKKSSPKRKSKLKN